MEGKRDSESLHDDIDTAVGAAADDLNTRIGEISERLKADGERLLESARELGEVISKQTRQHPLTACGIAFVAGIAVARLMRR